ncbi:uncharacterized protein EV420DRAFT_59972 [Desarmillaria tabescens]|uniref:Nucleoporin Nup54 alpha-helical domain-containing protein n=1 Tax=Armillaria tabescens TaxID=1929756 RepID=A0AA39NQL7_ARMTA|nr:uncharacterized protein EV420DRAFT_59972 [Desarmillaria tabescens]KAK0469733.1 hypothetical protein EV420DRAFT_59972 [Desarmillaria tabescens]
MAFASNTSAFGSSAFGKPASGSSIFGTPSTTTNTNAFSAFGQSNQQQQQQQQPATSSVFGQPSQPTTSLFGQPSQQQPAASTSLFGQPSQPQATTTTNPLFGQPAQQQQPQQQTTTSPFGQQNQNQTGTSLFGQPAKTGTTSLFGQPSQPATGTTSLFGQPSQSTTTTGTTSLFGQPSQQQAPATNIFGQSTGQQNQTQGSSLFGGSTSSAFGTSAFGGNNQAQQQQQQQPAGGLFGNTSTNALQSQPTVTSFGGGGSLFGRPQQTSFGSTVGTQAPAQASGPPLFTKTTKFNDLPDEIKRTFEQIESHIQGRIQISKDLQQRHLGEEPSKGQELIRGVHKDLVNTVSTIRSDLHYTKDLKAKAEQAVEDTIISMRIIDGFRNPQANGAYLKDHASFPFEFFNRLSKQMSERLAWCKNTIEQIERKLSSMAHQSQYTPHGISATLQVQHATFLALASKTAVLDAELQKIKVLYTQLWRSRTGSVRDPFNELDMDKNIAKGSDLGLSGLSVR